MNKFISKLIVVAFALGLLLPLVSSAATEVKPVEVYFFYGEGCPHCAKEEILLEKLEAEMGAGIAVHRYEVWQHPENAKLLEEISKLHPIAAAGVPITLIGDRQVIGYQSDETTGEKIRSLVAACQAGQLGVCPAKNLLDRAAGQTGPDTAAPAAPCPTGENTPSGVCAVAVPDDGHLISLPFWGTVNADQLSLPVLSVAIGLLDGFNPCAMWVLIFLLSLLMGIDSPHRRWLIGGVFIFASGLVYFLFMTAWLKAFSFLGYLWYIRAAIGIFAVWFGVHNLRDYWRQRKTGPVCEVTGSATRQKTFARLRAVAQEKNIWLALGGISAVAFAVNLVELACSAGFPAIFTSILALSGIPAWQSYLYLFIYIFFYMFDDLVVFIIAMLTMQATGLNSKYAKYSNLVGGAVILLLGLLLIFKPEWLAFG
ncbi:MAG: hypothetical protein WCT37_05050 [Patescibacteria group bacterium]|jgi:thiol-disulfide isomerase/thioredoxin